MIFKNYWGVTISLTIALAILFVELLLPLSWDNWVYHTAGWDLWKFGKWPYIGTWYFNFPGMAYIHAIAIALFGASDIAFRIFDVLFQIGTCYLLILTGRRYISEFASLITPIVYCLIYTSLGWSAAGQVDAFVAGFLLAGLLLIRRAFDALLNFTGDRRRYSLFFGGALVSFCTILRPTYLLFPAMFLCIVALDKPRRRGLIAVALGCSAGIIIPLTPYLFFEGGAYAFYTQAFRYGLDVYGAMNKSPIELWDSQRATILVVASYLSIALIAGIVYMRKRNARSIFRLSFDLRVYLAMMMCCLISILVMRKYLVSHTLPLVALISPLIAVGIASPAKIITKRWIGLGVSMLLLAFFGYRLFPRNLVRHFVDGSHSNLGPLIYCYDLQDNDTNCGYLAERDASNYMNKINPDKKSVEVLCYFRPYLRVQCNLEAVTRFTRIVPLVLPPNSGQYTLYQKEWRQEYLKKLQDTKPGIIVDADNGFRLGIANGPLSEAEKIEGFREFFAQNYHRDTVIHGFTFYKLN